MSFFNIHNYVSFSRLHFSVRWSSNGKERASASYDMTTKSIDFGTGKILYSRSEPSKGKIMK